MVWDLFFLFKDNFYKSKSVTEISSDMRSHLGFLFEQQDRDFPDISEMIKDLKKNGLQLQSTVFYDCKQKEDFIIKYTGIFSR